MILTGPLEEQFRTDRAISSINKVSLGFFLHGAGSKLGLA
jgi:hypothetical protein